MKLRSIHIAPIVFVLFIAGIGGTMLARVWITESSKVPVKIETGAFAGEYNPSDIRGSYSFADISEVFDVPVEALGKAFGVSENPGAFQVKNLEDMYGEIETETGMRGEIGTDSVRWFVALYRGLPYTPEKDTLLPASASSVLTDRVDETTMRQLKEYMVRLGDVVSAEAGAESSTAAAEHTDDPADTTIRGKTTFGELLNWGVTQEEIEAVLGVPMGPANEAVRDFCIDRGMEFSAVKEGLQELVR